MGVVSRLNRPTQAQGRHPLVHTACEGSEGKLHDSRQLRDFARAARINPASLPEGMEPRAAHRDPVPEEPTRRNNGIREAINDFHSALSGVAQGLKA